MKLVEKKKMQLKKGAGQNLHLEVHFKEEPNGTGQLMKPIGLVI